MRCIVQSNFNDEQRENEIYKIKNSEEITFTASGITLIIY